MADGNSTNESDFPPELECETYRRLHRDLAAHRDDDLREHYALHGRSEGRVANSLKGRLDFAALVGPNAKSLEIGPFANPLLAGPNTVYCDVLDTDSLVQRAKAIGADARRIPPITYVLDARGLDAIPEDFDAVLSSHAIEHQPDLVLHLQQVHRRLEVRGGRYFLLVPDQRYCFDHFMSPSTIAEIVDAHHARRTVHTLKSVVEHRALTCHNDAVRHWRGEHGERTVSAAAVAGAVNEWTSASGGYVDVHAWYFTPDSFAENIGLLNGLDLVRFSIERLYPTRRGAGEFWAILRAD